MPDEPSVQELKLVAEHGSGQIERALAAVRLAKRLEETDDLQDLLDDANMGVE